MKKFLFKIVCLLISVTIIITGVYGCFVFATSPEDNTVPRTAFYYVAPKGTGDGRTEATAAGSITHVMQSIVFDKYKEGDEVTIYVKGGEGATSVPSSGLAVNYSWPWPSVDGNNKGGEATTSANITITSMPDAESPAILSSGTDAPHVVLANTVYKNIILLNQASDGPAIYTNGYDVTIDEDVYFKNGKSLNSWEPSIHVGSFYNSGVRNDGDGTLIINNVTGNKKYSLCFGGYTWNGADGTTDANYLIGNKSVVINGGMVNKLSFLGFKRNAVYDANINLTLNNATINTISLSNISGYKPSINGNVQILATNGSVIPDLSSFVSQCNAPCYIIECGKLSSDLLSLTDSAGTYVVKKDESAIAINLDDNSKVYNSVTGLLTVPSGRYLVSKNSGGGNEAVYYVQYGGKGDGLSPENPLATVEDAVKAVNTAGYGTGDTVYINVMQSDDWEYGKNELGAGKDNRADAHHMTTWAARGTMLSHAAKIVVQSYGEDEVYLASNGQFGFNLDMVLGGPTEFRNITIVRMRRWRSILSNGYDVKYGEGTKIGCINVDECDSKFKTWDGKVDTKDGTTSIALGNVNKLPAGGGGTIEFNNGPIEVTTNISSTTDIWKSGVATGPTADKEKYTNDIRILYKNKDLVSNIRWGNQYGGESVFDKNLFIDLKQARKVNYLTGKGKVIINGDLQIVSCVETTDISNVSENVTVNGGEWYITVIGGSDLLESTDIAGTYNIKKDTTVIATDLNDISKTYTSVDGVLTLPSGKYEVIKIKNSEQELTYYVKYGGTGNGLTPENPIATVNDAVVAANDAGLGEGDTVYINVIQSDDWEHGKNELGAGGNYRSDPHHITTWSENGVMTAHRSKIIVQGYGEGEVYLASNKALGLNLDMTLGGHTVFKNITIVRMRKWRGIYANGYNVIFEETAKIGIINVDDCDKKFKVWDGKIKLADGYATYSLGNVKTVSNGGGGTIEFKNAPSASTIYISSNTDIWSGGVATGPSAEIEKYSNNVTIVIDNKKFSSKISWGNEYGGGSLFEKNLSISAKSVNTLAYLTGKGDVTINGNLQILAKAGINISELPENVTVNGEKWFISNAGSSDMIELTDVVGTFSIKEGVAVVATDLNDSTKTYISEEGTLTVPAGSYLITRYSAGGNEATYYVKYGGTGDGLTSETPMATVNDAVIAANDAGLGDGDTVYINVIQSDDWEYGKNELGAGGDYRSDPHHITTWSENGVMTAHRSKIIVQGYGDGEVYLASNKSLGLNLDMILGGPTVFKDVTIVRMRKWRGLLSNGYDVTYDEGTKIACLNVDDCNKTFKTWDGLIRSSDTTTMFGLGHKNQTSSGGGGTVIFNNEMPETTLYISGINSLAADVEKYKNDITIVYNNSKFYQKISWGQLEGGETVIEKDLRFDIKSASKLEYLSGKGKVTVNGSLQMILNCGQIEGSPISSIPENVTVKGGRWFISNNGNAELRYTSVAGTYTVGDGSVITAINVATKQKYASKNGILTLPEGEYVIEEVDDGLWWNPDDIDTDKDFSKVTVKGSFKDSNGNPITNVKLELVSDKNNYTAITDSKGNFSFGTIKAGFYELFTIDNAGKRNSTGYFATFEDGETVSLNIILDLSSQEVEVVTNNGTVKGNVYTPDLKPVGGIKVHLGTFGSMMTDKNGYFEFTEVSPGEYDIYTIMEDGSKQIMRTVTVKENTELSMKLKYEKLKKANQDNPTIFSWIWIAVAAGIVVIVGCGTVILLIIKRKRKVKIN